MASNAPPKIGTYYYRCEECGKKWVKRKSRGGADYCPKCSSEKPVYSYRFEKDIQKLRRMFGEFLCKCGNSWSSGNSWEGMGQQCRDCKTMILPHTLRPLRRSSGNEEGPPHMQEYCEMCQRLGHNCRYASTTDFEKDDDDAVSVVSTISTVSSNTPTGSDSEEQSGSDTENELVDDLSHLSFYKPTK